MIEVVLDAKVGNLNRVIDELEIELLGNLLFDDAQICILVGFCSREWLSGYRT